MLADRLYLDHAATTPVLSVARAAVAQGMEIWANPSSPHGPGRAARAALEEARARVKAALGWTGEVIFTSGASEAIGIAMGRTQNDVLLVGATEHDAVQRAAERVVVLPVGPDGLVAAHVLTGRLGALGAGLPLVVVQSANSETGVLQPLDELAPAVRKAGGLLFVDASQTVGKLALPHADLIAVSAHKFGGPPGIGALLVRDFAMLNASGGQERGYRGGTENLPGALGMAAALEAPRGWIDRAADLRAHLDGAIEAAGGQVIARTSHRIATIASYRMPGVASAVQLIQFDLAGIAVSAGSACSSGSLKPSHVLTAMGWSEADAAEVVRVSFGPDTTRADVYRFVEVWRRIAADAKARA
ncbi:cysteine desulfurase family protein [Sphingomonas sp. SUN039]|uniref:cysteine desulfurase family protein n=1 Tax=Sphingomonas sp. SUN039 TaxID=2937787 RepID=UPI0021640999|nr:aminotransferase class V-fold PLP-dependent enzyme [Sphingomonas sp. SUN039]UVO55859.1 aminotransferase class V-fold PLP-dependent enzyme [Sphingomonas sp. SUN039]